MTAKYPDETLFVPGAGLVERGELDAAVAAAAAYRAEDGGRAVEAADAAAATLYAGYYDMPESSRELLSQEASIFLDWAEGETSDQAEDGMG